jgi:protein SCO1/2
MGNRKSYNQLTVKIIVLIIAILIAGLYFGVFRQPVTQNVKISGVFLPHSTPIKEFSLTDTTKKSFTAADLKGHWTLLFFGFTNCGMVCPTTMAALNMMYQILEKGLPVSQLPQVMMITVDPERDTLARMAEYIASFNVHFKGARGESSQINALENQLHIAAVKLQADGAGKDHYTINHTAEIMVINPKGEVQAFLSYPHHAEEMAKDYKTIIAHTNF